MKKKSAPKKSPTVHKKSQWHQAPAWKFSIISVGVMFALALFTIFSQNNAPVRAYGGVPLYIKIIGQGNAVNSQYVQLSIYAVGRDASNTQVNSTQFSYPMDSVNKAVFVGTANQYYGNGTSITSLEVYPNLSLLKNVSYKYNTGPITFPLTSAKCTSLTNPCVFTVTVNAPTPTPTPTPKVCKTAYRTVCYGRQVCTQITNTCSMLVHYSNCVTKGGQCGVPADRNCSSGTCTASGICRAEGGRIVGSCMHSGTSGVCCRF